jgi:allantoinase
MSSTKVFRSAAVLTAGSANPHTVHVRDGVIERVGAFDEVPEGAELVDCGAGILLPGLVDTHVHINEPGRTEWEGFQSATRAAAAGGVTTLIEMPLNAIPPTTSVAGFTAKVAAARGQLQVDVGFWGGVVPGNGDQIGPLWDAGVFGFKAFMCPSGVEEFPAAGESDLVEVLPVLAALGAPLLVHAEDPDLLAHSVPAGAGRTRRHAEYLATRPPEAELVAIARLIALADRFGARVHVVHLSASEGIELLDRARGRGIAVTTETCPHYLAFAAEEIPDGATQFKCAPPIRDGRNRDRLWRGLRTGSIDLVATDHSPCPPSLKQPDLGDFFGAWGGISSIQLGLPAVWTAARRRGFGPADLVRWMCEGPARLAGLHDRGAIAPGMRADLTVLDPDHEWTVDPGRLLNRHRVTPWAGACLTGMVRATFLRGDCVYRDGQISGPPRGRVLLRPSHRPG